MKERELKFDIFKENKTFLKSFLTIFNFQLFSKCLCRKNIRQINISSDIDTEHKHNHNPRGGKRFVVQCA